MGVRFSIIFLILILLYAGLTINLYDLQIKKGVQYLARAESQFRAAGEFEPERGNIFFTDKNNAVIPAAIRKYYPKIFAVPKEIDNPELVADRLAPILGMTVEKILERISSESHYRLLKRRVSSELANQIQSLNLTGIYAHPESHRFYPHNSLASHVLGFVSEGSGRYGMEAFYNEILKGERGYVSEDRVVMPKNGRDIHLTIDYYVQVAAEEILGKLVDTHSADGGLVIVMHPQKGDILAMAGLPNFDPNRFGEFKMQTFPNRAVQAIYEPGSIFKVITMAAGIDSGKISPETEFVDEGRVVVNNRTISNWDFRAHGRVTMTNILERSINTGTVFAVQKMGRDIFYNYLRRFRINERTGIDLVGEIRGDIRNLRENRDIYFATASFGQGIAVTPIGLLTAINAIANGGIMVSPRFLADSSTKTNRVISESSSRQVVEMMVSAVDRGRVAQISGYTVAGKTGTAQVPDLAAGGYTDEVFNTFVGFAPAYEPRFIVFMRLDKPAGSPLASQTLVPAFREFTQFLLNYYDVLPDRIDQR